MNVGGNARLRIKIKGWMYRHANEPFIKLGGLKFTLYLIVSLIVSLHKRLN